MPSKISGREIVLGDMVAMNVIPKASSLATKYAHQTDPASVWGCRWAIVTDIYTTGVPYKRVIRMTIDEDDIHYGVLDWDEYVVAR